LLNGDLPVQEYGIKYGTRVHVVRASADELKSRSTAKGVRVTVEVRWALVVFTAQGLRFCVCVWVMRFRGQEDGQPLRPIVVCLSDTLDTFKATIKHPAPTQRVTGMELFVRGAKLWGNRKLSEYGIQDGSRVKVVMKPGSWF
jgi:hypothetical protein